MGKLTNLRPTLGILAPAVHVESRQVLERERFTKRDEDTSWRAWYKTERWRRLRLDVLARDAYKCQRTGVMLIGKYPDPHSPVVDHVVPHRGNPELFWDSTNLQSVSKGWHDSIKQSIERGGIAVPHPDWFRPSLIPLTIVCGPPASGKSTYIRDRAGPNDLIIDIDIIASEMAGTATHGWDRDQWLNAAIYRRNDIIGQLSRPSDWSAAWLIVGEPKAKWRQWWATKLKPKAIIVIETPEIECIRRVKADPLRPWRGNSDGITRWWFDYDRRRGDIIIR